eukprot:CAMPEP_0180303848 /NCGR_PEP_ID=MMETSP0988-20121125/25343_1 /TAXON_ID=697907 /ORGANISM="non described non described, Strain CCMP2293" /LENGTH=245 /DNA_ID=CAMNT_0022285705 /DNA_START=118 /DNA_END=852 /DNA_ORIENTATION=+
MKGHQDSSLAVTFLNQHLPEMEGRQRYAPPTPPLSPARLAELLATSDGRASSASAPPAESLRPSGTMRGEDAEREDSVASRRSSVRRSSVIFEGTDFPEARGGALAPPSPHVNSRKDKTESDTVDTAAPRPTLSPRGGEDSFKRRASVDARTASGLEPEVRTEPAPMGSSGGTRAAEVAEAAEAEAPEASHRASHRTLSVQLHEPSPFPESSPGPRYANGSPFPWAEGGSSDEGAAAAGSRSGDG